MQQLQQSNWKLKWEPRTNLAAGNGQTTPAPEASVHSAPYNPIQRLISDVTQAE